MTYNNSDILNNWALRSVYEYLSIDQRKFVETVVINNHSNFFIEPRYIEMGVKVRHNIMRPDFSTGHLARNWNECIIDGFKSLTHSDCDIVILIQHDTIIKSNYIDKLIDLHFDKKIEFYTAGSGDQFVSQTVGAIKTVGLWDERFCNIGYQEADYFMRQLLYNSNNISVNDHDHLRTHNVIDLDLLENTLPGLKRGDNHHRASSKFHNYCGKLWYYKYNYNHWNWDANYILANKEKIVNKVPYYVYYPYFEKDVDTLVAQGLIWDRVEDVTWF